MDREEIILSCQETVKNLVKKYNNHHADEDLQSVGMIAVIECVNRCEDDGLTDVNQIQARCNVWAKNRILNEIYKEKIKYSTDDVEIDEYEAPEDLTEFLMMLKEELTPKQLEVFELLCNGEDDEKIMKKLNITSPTLYGHKALIKEKIKNLKYKQ